MHIILVGDYTRRHSVAALSVLQVAACAALAWLATGLASATGWQPVRFGWQAQSLLGIAICAVLATAVAFSVQLWAQQYTSSSHAAVLFTLEPVFASLTSYILLRETLGHRAMLGAGFVLAGILIAELFGPPAAPESPEPTRENAVNAGGVA
jgi:drug/metabolite transporter (DMT)-like permease